MVLELFEDAMKREDACATLGNIKNNSLFVWGSFPLLIIFEYLNEYIHSKKSPLVSSVAVD